MDITDASAFFPAVGGVGRAARVRSEDARGHRGGLLTGSDAAPARSGGQTQLPAFRRQVSGASCCVLECFHWVDVVCTEENDEASAVTGETSSATGQTTRKDTETSHCYALNLEVKSNPPMLSRLFPQEVRGHREHCAASVRRRRLPHQPMGGRDQRARATGAWSTHGPQTGEELLQQRRSSCFSVTEYQR